METNEPFNNSMSSDDLSDAKGRRQSFAANKFKTDTFAKQKTLKEIKEENNKMKVATKKFSDINVALQEKKISNK